MKPVVVVATSKDLSKRVPRCNIYKLCAIFVMRTPLLEISNIYEIVIVTCEPSNTKKSWIKIHTERVLSSFCEERATNRDRSNKLSAISWSVLRKPFRKESYHWKQQRDEPLCFARSMVRYLLSFGFARFDTRALCGHVYTYLSFAAKNGGEIVRETEKEINATRGHPRM